MGLNYSYGNLCGKDFVPSQALRGMGCDMWWKIPTIGQIQQKDCMDMGVGTWWFFAKLSQKNIANKSPFVVLSTGRVRSGFGIGWWYSHPVLPAMVFLGNVSVMDGGKHADNNREDGTRPDKTNRSFHSTILVPICPSSARRFQT